MAIIKAPNEQYNGITATIKFDNGIGQTEDKKLIKWFEEHGYSVQKDDKSTKNKKGKQEDTKDTTEVTEKEE
jgi:hypothetical protein